MTQNSDLKKVLQKEINTLNNKILKVRDQRVDEKDPLWGVGTESIFQHMRASYKRIIDGLDEIESV